MDGWADRVDEGAPLLLQYEASFSFGLYCGTSLGGVEITNRPYQVFLNVE
jgi:hypothetical protein